MASNWPVMLEEWSRKNAFLVPFFAILNTWGRAKTSTYVTKWRGSLSTRLRHLDFLDKSFIAQLGNCFHLFKRASGMMKKAAASLL
jgi:hypothetical protein